MRDHNEGLYAPNKKRSQSQSIHHNSTSIHPTTTQQADKSPTIKLKAKGRDSKRYKRQKAKHLSLTSQNHGTKYMNHETYTTRTTTTTTTTTTTSTTTSLTMKSQDNSPVHQQNFNFEGESSFEEQSGGSILPEMKSPLNNSLETDKVLYHSLEAPIKKNYSPKSELINETGVDTNEPNLSSSLGDQQQNDFNNLPIADLQQNDLNNPPTADLQQNDLNNPPIFLHSFSDKKRKSGSYQKSRKKKTRSLINYPKQNQNTSPEQSRKTLSYYLKKTEDNWTEIANVSRKAGGKEVLEVKTMDFGIVEIIAETGKKSAKIRGTHISCVLQSPAGPLGCSGALITFKKMRNLPFVISLVTMYISMLEDRYNGFLIPTRPKAPTTLLKLMDMQELRKSKIPPLLSKQAKKSRTSPVPKGSDSDTEGTQKLIFPMDDC